VHADPPDMLDPGLQKRARAEAALDSLRGRFGDRSIETGYTFRPQSRAKDGT